MARRPRNFDGVALDGLNVALAASIPGLPSAGNWTAGIYIDAKASEEQKDALTNIFSGQAGGQPGALSGAITEVLGITSAEIDYQAEGKRHSLRIQNIAEAEIEALENQRGEQVDIHNLPRWISRGFPLTVAKSTRMSYHDHGLTWELSEKSGYYSPFSYSGP